MNPFAFCIRLIYSQLLYKQEMVKLRSELRFELTQSQWQGCLNYMCVCVCVYLCMVEIDMAFLQSLLTF